MNLWGEQELAYSGEYYSYGGIFFEPKPVQQPRIPIWVGGHTRRALRRTANTATPGIPLASLLSLSLATWLIYMSGSRQKDVALTRSPYH